MSDDLRTHIVISGIDNPQIHATAANADVSPENIVSFLSIYKELNKIWSNSFAISKDLKAKTLYYL